MACKTTVDKRDDNYTVVWVATRYSLKKMFFVKCKTHTVSASTKGKYLQGMKDKNKNKNQNKGDGPKQRQIKI